MLALQYIGESFFKLKKYKFSKIASKKLRSLTSRHPEEQLSNYFFDMAGMTIANCNLLLGNNNQAKAIFDETLNNDSNIDNIYDAESKAAILSNAVLTYLNTDKNRSIECFREADLIYDSLDSDNPAYINEHILLLLLSGAPFQDDIQQMRYYLQKAMGLADSATHEGYYLPDSTLAGLYSTLASLLSAENKETAEEYCDMVLDKHSNGKDDKDRISRSLLTCIDTYLRLGKTEKATVAMDKLLNLPPSFSDYNTAFYDNWAALYFYRGVINLGTNSEACEQYLNKSIEKFEQRGDAAFEMPLFGNANGLLGVVYLNKGDYQSAREKCQMAVRVYKRILMKNDDVYYWSQLINHSNNYALSLMYLNQLTTAYVKAKENLDRIDKIPREHPEYFSLITNAYTLLSDILFFKGEKNNSILYLEKAIDSAKEGHGNQSDIDNLENLLQKRKES